MNDFLIGRAVYRPLNDISPKYRREEHSSLLPVLTKRDQPDELAEAVEPEIHNEEPEMACHRAEPEIELIEAEGRIEKIIVTCRCGEKITLHCSY